MLAALGIGATSFLLRGPGSLHSAAPAAVRVVALFGPGSLQPSTSLDSSWEDDARRINAELLGEEWPPPTAEPAADAEAQAAEEARLAAEVKAAAARQAAKAEAKAAKEAEAKAAKEAEAVKQAEAVKEAKAAKETQLAADAKAAAAQQAAEAEVRLDARALWVERGRAPQRRVLHEAQRLRRRAHGGRGRM